MINTLLSLALHRSRIAIPVHLLIMDVSFIMYFEFSYEAHSKVRTIRLYKYHI